MQLVNSKSVMQRLGGISRVSLWRYVNDPDLDFPQPIVVRTRRFWKEDDLAKWVDSRAH
ncbi:transcriptional regulator [Fuscovulum blasticum DSM 2131]|uniref:Transcriptional regulator n=1 Tax=Fuscovulum blasticum DSM 2131 TaxID=1188250 RepID=A0A2T4J486_FUSBL|nr:transcriptional regulator [Fuscovulum blasticum DSM 2131]